MNKNRQTDFENRANYQNRTENPHCHSCGEELIFGMKDNYHEFSLGLSTVLECLLVAEQKGHIPKIPAPWWISVCNRYPQIAKLRSCNEQ